MNIDRLKNFAAAKSDVDELVALSAFARSLADEYDEHEVDRPDWLVFATNGIAKELKTRKNDEVHRKLTSARARLETLKTTGERRRETESEISRLEAALK